MFSRSDPGLGGSYIGGRARPWGCPGVAATMATVEFTLKEFSVSADPASVPAGSVTFEATNDGGRRAEFVVIAMGPRDQGVSHRRGR